MTNAFPGNQRLAARLSLALILFCSTLLITACPSEAQLDRAAKASKAIATRTGEVITLVDGFYTSGVIKIDVKDKLATKLLTLSKAGRDFNNLIAKYSALYKDGKVPGNVWAEITTNFDAIWAPFGQLMALVPQAAGLKDSKAFQIITQSVMAIAKILMTNGVNVPQFRIWEQRVGDYGLA